MTTAALVVRGLKKSFGSKRAVRDASFSVRTGDITGFLGPNGAGKTTVMSMVVGLVEPDEGEIELFGKKNAQRSREARARIGYLQEKPRVYPEMTSRHYLRFFADLYGVPDAAERVEEVLTRVGLKAAGNRLLGTYSRGMQQRACLARVMLHRPDFLVLDEPTLGLDPNGIADMRSVFRDMKSDGVTLLFSSHQLAEMERICDSVVFMNEGRVIAAGSPSDILPREANRRPLRAELYETALIGIEKTASLKVVKDARSVGAHQIDFSLDEDTECGREARARAVALLSSRGLTVLSVNEANPTLEDIFLDLTKPGLGSVEPQGAD